MDDVTRKRTINTPCRDTATHPSADADADGTDAFHRDGRAQKGAPTGPAACSARPGVGLRQLEAETAVKNRQAATGGAARCSGSGGRASRGIDRRA